MVWDHFRHNLLDLCILLAPVSDIFVTMNVNLHELIFSVLKALGHIVYRLVFGDRVRLDSSFRWVEGSQLRLVAETVGEFSERREKTGSKSFNMTVLTTKSKLNSKPIALKIKVQNNFQQNSQTRLLNLQPINHLFLM